MSVYNYDRFMNKFTQTHIQTNKHEKDLKTFFAQYVIEILNCPSFLLKPFCALCKILRNAKLKGHDHKIKNYTHTYKNFSSWAKFTLVKNQKPGPLMWSNQPKND